jgi:hypothetical protein
MESNRFPLLGFPGETNVRDGDILYRCYFEGKARVALWKHKHDRTYALNLYHARFTDESLTHVRDRISLRQGPIYVDDAFEAQLAIFYLVQKYLPTGVTDDISHAYQEDGGRTHAADIQAAEMRADAASGETMV